MTTGENLRTNTALVIEPKRWKLIMMPDGPPLYVWHDGDESIRVSRSNVVNLDLPPGGARPVHWIITTRSPWIDLDAVARQ